MAQDLHPLGLADTSSTSHMHEQRLGLSFLQSDALLHTIAEAFSAWRQKIANPMHCCTLSSKPFLAWRRKIESSAHVWQSGLSSFRVSSWGLSASTSTSVPFWLPLAAPDAKVQVPWQTSNSFARWHRSRHQWPLPAQAGQLLKSAAP